jgi:hypothetical protein
MNRPAAFAFPSAILRGRRSLMSAVVSPAPMNRDAITDCARAMKKPGAVSRPGYDILLQSTPFIAKRRNVVNRFGSAAHMQQGEKVENGSSDSTQIFPFYSPTVRSERR